jgi:alkanesulfonate monooxygenase SsuD/methylene tetrahydromethanopterin reductase-like flavin-dependent oxidoreductase (luciferase family)
MAKFGFRLPDFPLDSSDSPTFHRQIRENMDAVAEGGFDSAWVADHFIPWATWKPEDEPTVECWTTLSHLSALYPDLTWGPIVFCQSYRNPAVLAKKVAALCAFIPGKFVFGIGAGWKDNEYRMYNFPFPKASVRIKQMEEQIEIAKRLWTEDHVTWEGEHYAVYDCVVSPKPDPLPPVMVGGGGEKLTLRVAAKHADWWNFQGGTIEYFQHKLNVLKGTATMLDGTSTRSHRAGRPRVSRSPIPRKRPRRLPGAAHSSTKKAPSTVPRTSSSRSSRIAKPPAATTSRSGWLTSRTLMASSGLPRKCCLHSGVPASFAL